MDGHNPGTVNSGASGVANVSSPSGTETKIIIDGSGDDWAGRPLLLDDPAGNAESGILDLTTGYAFVNEHALYLLIEADDPESVFSQFEIELELGPKRLEVIWSPQWKQGFVADVTG